MTSPLDDAAAVAVERTLAHLGEGLVASDPRDEWLDLGDKTIRHELRLELTGALVALKRRLREGMDPSAYVAAADDLEHRIAQAIGFRTFLDAHSTVLARLRVAVRGAGVGVALLLVWVWLLPYDRAPGLLAWGGILALAVLGSVAAWLPNAPHRWWTAAHLTFVRVRCRWLFRGLPTP